MITEIQPEVVAVTAQVMGAMPFIARNTIDRAHNPAYAAGYLYNQVKPRMAMATHVSYDEYVIPELIAEVRTHWNGPFAFGAPDMVVVNMTKDRIWVRDGVVSKYPNMAPPQFDMAPSGGLVVLAPFNRRQDVQEQSIRNAEITPDRYYPKGYQPDTLPFWPSDKPIFLPENMVRADEEEREKGAMTMRVPAIRRRGRARRGAHPLSGAVANIDRCDSVDAASQLGLRRSFGSLRARAADPRWMVLLGVLCLTLSACAGPVGAVRVDPKVAHGRLARSAITTGEQSWPTRNVLFERGLFEAFGERPDAVLADLHREMVARRGDQDLLFALTELSFLHGQASRKPGYFLAAVVYAYAFLFPEGAGHAPGRFDPRVRIAADLYNWALTAVFASEDGSEVVPRGGALELPFGQLEVTFDPAALRAGDRELHRFTPVAELEVYGLQMRYRWPGLGAPLAAATRPIDASRPGRDMVAPRLQVSVTALLRIPEARRALVQGRPLTGTLELHLAWDAELVSIAGEQVPLENEPSAALALTFTGAPIVELETLGLLGRLSGLMQERPPLISATPYRPGLIPVVFVHGTGSSVLRWAEMYNRLAADPEIRSRFQFWFFQYDSGNPIALSSLRLREALSTAVARLDPEGRDPALRQMILIGHSQGGLLVKMQVVSTGDQLWNAVSSKPLAELQLSDQTRDLFRRGLFVEPLPTVSRAIFICTPHRGSFVAGRRVLANLTRQLLTLPFALTGVAADINRNPGAARVGFVPTAVDNMAPGNPFILGLQAIPVVPSVKVHSIIAVDGDGAVEQGDDGVVQYSAAHIEPVESELVVRSSHSAQGNPHTIEEVRRILWLQAGLP